MSNILESDFISKEGYRCVVLGISHGHRCGYVAVPRGHVLYGIKYHDALPASVAFVTEELMRDAEVSHRGVMPLLIAAFSGNINRLDCVIDVHGSLTFSEPSDKTNYPVPTDADVWWFGFDCGHSGDGKDFSLMEEKTKEFYRKWGSFADGPIRTKDYVESHCRLLSRQLWYINSMVAQSALPEGDDEMSNKNKNPELVKLKDGLSKSLFSCTPDEARDKGICVSCKSPIRYEVGADTSGENGQIYSDSGVREYRITALCETCFDSIFDESITGGEREIEDLESFVLNS